MDFLGWREVPVRREVLGSRAAECMPCIQQGFIARPEKIKQGIDFDRRLYVVRRIFEQSSDDTYVASLSSRTIAYKGMFLVGQLRPFFEDLQNPDYESAIALVRYNLKSGMAILSSVFCLSRNPLTILGILCLPINVWIVFISPWKITLEF